MTDTELLLVIAMVAGFALLGLSVVAFATHRPRAGLTLLILACVACISCYPLLASAARADRESVDLSHTR